MRAVGKVENQRRRRASAQSFIHRTHARPWDEHSRLRRSAGNQRACLLTTLFVLPTGRVLTTLKAPDERGEATLPQVLPPLPAHGMRICPSSTEPAASRSSCSTSTPSRPCWARTTRSRSGTWRWPSRSSHQRILPWSVSAMSMVTRLPIGSQRRSMSLAGRCWPGLLFWHEKPVLMPPSDSH